MENRKIVIAVVALLLLAVFLISRCNGDRYNWNEWDTRVSYVEKEKEPYSLLAFKRLADEVFAGRMQEITKAELVDLDTAKAAGSTYVFIGLIPYYDSTEVHRLINYLHAGGTAFISSRTLSGLLTDTLFYHPDCTQISDMENVFSNQVLADTLVECTLEAQPDLKVSYSLYRKNKRIPNNWPAVKSDWLCEYLDWSIMGKYANEDVNFAEFRFGKGRLYLHTTPLAFTNFHMLRSETQPYISALLPYMQGERIYWDTYAKSDEAREKAFRIPKAAKTMRNSGMLATLLREPALAFSWFILLGLVGLFLVFGSKREQRMIPVIPPPKNGTLRFVQSLARLQFRQRSFRTVCKQDMRFFLNTVRERTGIVVPMRSDGRVSFDDKLIDRISVGTGFPRDKIKDIFTQYEPCAIYEPDGDMMTNLHMAIETFIHFKRQPGKS